MIFIRFLIKNKKKLKNFFLIKYTFYFLFLFSLIKDLFPGVDCPRIGYPDFNAAVEFVLRTGNFILMNDQVRKMFIFILYCLLIENCN